MAGDTRVLQVVLSLEPGGTERLVMEMASRLHDTMPMMVCCLDEPGAWADALRERGVAVHALGRRPGVHPSLGRRIASLANAHGATVMHAHQYSPFVYAAIARCWRPSTRLVFTEHGRLSDAPPSAKRRLANRALGLLPHRVFAVSDDLRRHMLAESFGADAVEVIYNGIDIGPLPGPSERDAARARLGVADEVPVIGTIARLDPVKDLGTLIRAVADVPGTPHLLIIGSGPEEAALDRLATDRGIADRVRFLGHRDDAREWLAGCDVYVNSSISEGVSLTILEAMAAGLPIVATAVGGTPEVVDDTCGRLVPPRDPAALAAAIGELLSDPARAKTLGAAARLRVESRFTLDHMVNEYRAVYLNPERGTGNREPGT